MENKICKSEESNVIDEVSDTSGLASRWDRLWASLIDTLTIIFITIPVMYFTGGFAEISEGEEPSIGYMITISVISTVMFLIIHGRYMVRDGQTLGKKALNIKIVTISGHHANVSVLAKRYGFYWLIPLIPVIGPLINVVNVFFIFGKSKRCLHDCVAGTKVISANKQSQSDA